MLFWALTPAELRLVLGAISERRDAERRERRAEVYSLAALIGSAINNPKKFPKARDFIDGAAKSRFSSDAEIRAYMVNLSARAADV